VKLLGFISLPLKSQEMSFIKIGESDYLIGISGKDTMAIGTRIKHPVYPEDWTQKEGKYEIINDTAKVKFFSSMKLENDHGLYKLSYTDIMNDRESFTILPLNEKEAVVAGIGRETGYTVTFTQDGFLLTGVQFRKVIK
jgi:hypothetical protein